MAKDLSEMLEMTGGKGSGSGREPGYLLGYTGPPAGVLPEGDGAIEEATYEPMDQDEDYVMQQSSEYDNNRCT